MGQIWYHLAYESRPFFKVRANGRRGGMKLISRNTDYALRAVCFMAKQSDRTVSASELVKALKIPRPFLRKILQALGRARILRSTKGARGGFVLLRAPSEIHITDIMKAFQGPFRLNECAFKKKPCPDMSACRLRKKICAIEKRVYEELRKISVISMLE
jgi:Rrf2 family protein